MNGPTEFVGCVVVAIPAGDFRKLFGVRDIVDGMAIDALHIRVYGFLEDRRVDDEIRSVVNRFDVGMAVEAFLGRDLRVRVRRKKVEQDEPYPEQRLGASVQTRLVS